MKTVITYGTFDLLHVGHVRLLKRLKNMGDKLIVGLSSDNFNLQKGKCSFFSFDERKEILLSTKYVDEVISEDCWEQKIKDVIKYNASVFAIGNDWEGKFDFLKEYCEVVYLPRTENISTTDIKKRLEKISAQDIQQIESKIHEIFDVIRTIKQ
ncbi:TPA: glycerol-3-phosphate cytidylyltransferase [Vibrio cholerae]|nr:glycerol-3-phosphate cytidylyltransferase [Vibrio cholerae]